MNNNKIKAKTLPGFMELLPNEQVLFNKLKNIIQSNYEKYGFLPIDTPIIEDSNVLLAKAGGETEKQIYRFNKGDNDLALRFDLTVPLAKYVTQYYDKLSFPFKRYQIGKVYRGEKAQRGRYREFYQCDIDIIGDGKLSLLNDAEIPSIIYNIFKELNFDDFTICINNRKILNGLFNSLELNDKSKDILIIIDKLDKIGIEKVKNELLDINIDEYKINTIIDFIKINGSNDNKIISLENLNIDDEMFKLGIYEIKEVIKYMRLFNIPENNFKLDLTIARGLDYYTGTVYETFFNNYRKLGSVCSGGRYDNLAEYYTDKKLPGVGISIGLTRLFYQLITNEIIKVDNDSLTDVLVTIFDDEYEMAIKVSNELRRNNIKTKINVENDKIGKKFKYADKLNIKYVIIIGEDEVKNNNVSLKNMVTGNQETLTIEEVIKKIK